MFDYKGIAKVRNRELIGDLVRRNGKYYILPRNDENLGYEFITIVSAFSKEYTDKYLAIYEAFPESLSVTYTGLTDKNGTQIFASFEVDGKMSRGGDIVKIDFDISHYNVRIDTGCFVIYNEYEENQILVLPADSIEIIGKQWSENEN